MRFWPVLGVGWIAPCSVPSTLRVPRALLGDCADVLGLLPDEQAVGAIRNPLNWWRSEDDQSTDRAQSCSSSTQLIAVEPSLPERRRHHGVGGSDQSEWHRS